MVVSRTTPYRPLPGSPEVVPKAPGRVSPIRYFLSANPSLPLLAAEGGGPWATMTPSASRVAPAESSNAGPLPATVAAHSARVTARYRSHGRPSRTDTAQAALDHLAANGHHPDPADAAPDNPEGSTQTGVMATAS